ncbi:MAG: hypothetical protein AAF804_22495, partial [Bacteroidota bacterium]
MLRSVLLLFTYLLLNQALLAQEELRAPVVLIESGQELGTGILVGQAAGQLYLITAGHVIDDPSDIRLRFRNGHRAIGTLLRDERPGIDL